MRESKMDLIGRETNDINREFQHLLNKINEGYPSKISNNKQIKDHWNSDIDGWINWLESLKI